MDRNSSRFCVLNLVHLAVAGGLAKQEGPTKWVADIAILGTKAILYRLCRLSKRAWPLPATEWIVHMWGLIKGPLHGVTIRETNMILPTKWEQLPLVICGPGILINPHVKIAACYTLAGIVEHRNA